MKDAAVEVASSLGGWTSEGDEDLPQIEDTPVVIAMPGVINQVSANPVVSYRANLKGNRAHIHVPASLSLIHI